MRPHAFLRVTAHSIASLTFKNSTVPVSAMLCPVKHILLYLQLLDLESNGFGVEFSYRTCQSDGLWAGDPSGKYSQQLNSNGWTNYLDCYPDWAKEGLSVGIIRHFIKFL